MGSKKRWAKCVIPSMPRAIIEAASADIVVTLHKIPATIHKCSWM